MRITITVENLTALRAAVAGLRSVDDAGDGLLVQLEERAAAESRRARLDAVPSWRAMCPPPAARVATADVIAAWNAHGGNVAATARALGIARSTVRDRVARYTAALPLARAANDTR